MKRSYISLALLICLPLAVGCGHATADVSQVVNSEYLLKAEPTGALDVIDLREQAQDGQAVVVLGRIGGGIAPWVDGRAAFMLVDERVQPSCGDEQCGEGCAKCAQELADATTLVKFVDPAGKVLAVDARQLLGVQERQTVVIRGVAHRDPAGSVSVSATGLYIRK